MAHDAGVLALLPRTDGDEGDVVKDRGVDRGREIAGLGLGILAVKRLVGLPQDERRARGIEEPLGQFARLVALRHGPRHAAPVVGAPVGADLSRIAGPPEVSGRSVAPVVEDRLARRRIPAIAEGLGTELHVDREVLRARSQGCEEGLPGSLGCFGGDVEERRADLHDVEPGVELLGHRIGLIEDHALAPLGIGERRSRELDVALEELEVRRIRLGGDRPADPARDGGLGMSDVGHVRDHAEGASAASAQRPVEVVVLVGVGRHYLAAGEDHGQLEHARSAAAEALAEGAEATAEGEATARADARASAALDVEAVGRGDLVSLEPPVARRRRHRGDTGHARRCTLGHEGIVHGDLAHVVGPDEQGVGGATGAAVVVVARALDHEAHVVLAREVDRCLDVLAALRGDGVPAGRGLPCLVHAGRLSRARLLLEVPRVLELRRYVDPGLEIGPGLRRADEATADLATQLLPGLLARPRGARRALSGRGRCARRRHGSRGRGAHRGPGGEAEEGTSTQGRNLSHVL